MPFFFHFVQCNQYLSMKQFTSRKLSSVLAGLISVLCLSLAGCGQNAETLNPDAAELQQAEMNMNQYNELEEERLKADQAAAAASN